MPDSTTPKGPFFDGMGMKAVINYMKDYHDANMGSGGSSQIPYPGLQVEYNNDNDYCLVYCTTGYEGIESEVTLGYTTDGTTPSVSSPEFVSPQRIEKNCTLMVRAFVAVSTTNIIESPSNSVIISGLKCQNVQYAFNSGTKQVTLTCPTQGATIRYTTNGADPDEHSTVYEGPFTLQNGYKIKAVATKIGIDDSDIVQVNLSLGHVFGIRRKMTGYSSPDWERLTSSTDPNELTTETVSQEPQAEISGVQSGYSMFDSYKPWQKKMRNFLDDGTPGPWMDEEGFSLTDMDVMVYYPVCYVKLMVDTENDYVYRYISDYAMEGFELAPWSRMYGARYLTSNNIESRSGASPQVSQSIVGMRTNARSKGSGWGIHDWIERSANQWLFTMEYASYDSQSKIGKGVVSLGEMRNTGGTDTMTYHTGRPAGVDGQVSIQYRYSEDLWGNVDQLCDGINSVSGQIYVSIDRENYQSDIGDPYIPVGVTIESDFYGGIDTIVQFENVMWSFGIPASTSGSNSTYLCDYGRRTTNAGQAIKVGGSYNSGNNAGLFGFQASITSSNNTETTRGSRLTFKEVEPFDPEITITAA